MAAVETLAIVVFSAVGFILAYRFYGRFISRRIFNFIEEEPMPSHAHRDGRDFVPTRRAILFGHHYTSIAGAGPIVGPAIGVVWGWLPAVLWIVFGSIFIGAVHDLAALSVSARHGGRTLGDISRDILNPRVRIVFFLFVLFALTLVLAVFLYFIASLFIAYPGSVLPIWLQIPIAVTLGWALYRKGFGLPIAATLAVVAMFLTIILGHFVPIDIQNYLPEGNTGILSPFFVWIMLLLGYCFFASILPVQVLLQPRDYINSNELYIGLILIVAGFMIAPQPMAAPALTTGFEGAPPLFPMLFIVIACGAISGFHCLVASGTTVKQLDKASDACPIAYGGMLLEGVLAVIVVVACCSGLSAADWATRYASWNSAQAGALGSFVLGSASYISAVGIPEAFAQTLVAVLIVSFCATTLDTATRIQRYVITELAGSFKMRQLAKPVPATLLVCLMAISLSMFRDPVRQVIGSGGYILWPLFGTINQMLGCLALMIATVYLAKRRKPIVFTAIPMLFLLLMTGWAIFRQTKGFILPPAGAEPNYPLLGVSAAIILLEVWMLIEGIIAFTGVVVARAAQTEGMVKA